MGKSRALLEEYYSKSEIKRLKLFTGHRCKSLAEYLQLDFIDQGDEVPTSSELEEHIDYQEKLMSIDSDCSETEYGVRWTETFCY